MPSDVKPPAPCVLAVDGDHRARRVLASQLVELGCEVEQAGTREEALDLVRCRPFALAICDAASARGGMDLLSQLLELRPDLPVVVISRLPKMESVSEAMRRGAKDYLPKPLPATHVRRLAAEALERAIRQAGDTRDDVLDRVVPRTARDLVHRAASCDFPVLIRGEHGTGKGAVARAIHERGVRRGGSFEVVSARELRDADDLLRACSAAGGSLLIDEAGELAPSLQEALLRRMRESSRSGASPNGGVRVLATASCDLVARAREGAFLVDLLHELTVLEIALPPLRRRPLEILPLSEALVAQAARRRGVEPPTFSLAARRLLVTWTWPGNVRELSDVLEHAISRFRGRVMGTDIFPERMKVRSGDAATAGAPLSLQELEREHVTRVVAWASTFDDAARVLGIEPSTVRRKLRSWEVRAWSESTSQPEDIPAGEGPG